MKHYFLSVALALQVSGIFVPVIAQQEIPALRNMKVYSPNLISSGQPDRNNFDALAKAGVQLVINLAPAQERTSIKDEEQLVRGNGMEYAYIPVDWNKPDKEGFKNFMEVMDRSKNMHVLVHCSFNSRASAFVYLYRRSATAGSKDQDYQVMEEIWERNRGYELRSSPQWVSFINEMSVSGVK